MVDYRIVIVIVIALIILAFILYLLYNTRNTRQASIQTKVANGSIISGTGLLCGPDQCVTNIYNGSKICPTTQGGTLIADPVIEVCNSRFLCENSLTPFALQSDGSTNLNGICQRGVACRCLRSPQCSSNILSTFTTSNGTPYQPFNGQRIIINQTLVPPAPTTNIAPITPNVVNFQIVDPLINFCTITNSWLNNLNPGICNDLVVTDPIGMSECQNRNPCIAGTLAFIPTNIEQFDATQINVTSLGCVYGSPCNIGDLTVWDTEVNDIRCISI